MKTVVVWRNMGTTFCTKKKNKKAAKILASFFVQHLALPVPAAAEDLGPAFEAGGGGGEHDQELFLQAQATHASRGVEAACSRQNLPGDGVGEALVLQLPDMGGQPCAWLVPVPAVAFVP